MTKKELIDICGKSFINKLKKELKIKPVIKILEGNPDDYAEAGEDGVIAIFAEDVVSADKDFCRWIMAHECRHIWQFKYVDFEDNSFTKLREKLLEILITAERVKNKKFKRKELLELVLDNYHDMLPEEMDANIYAFIKTGYDFSKTHVDRRSMKRLWVHEDDKDGGKK